MLSALLLAGLGSATPIVVPPAPERLVEGHTVFAVLDVVARVNQTAAEFHAAVAVLVREYRAEERVQRFPGVLWSNDQYLTAPYHALNGTRLGRDPHHPQWRYPCGGAVLAVNAGDPDPRVAIARMNGTYATHPAIEPVLDGEVSKTHPGDATTYEGDYAWLDVEFNATNATDPYLHIHSDTLRSGSRYEKSYTITDPNDHTWVIDKYSFYQRDEIPRPLSQRGIYEYPVWVVNLYGSPVFVPDDPQQSCMPFADLLSGRTLAPYGFCEDPDDAQGHNGLALDCGQSELHSLRCNGRLRNGHDTGGATPGYLGSSPYVDDPCRDYREPSRNGYCYGGQRADATDPCADRAAQPLRTYNALLYFDIADLRVAGDPRDHSDPYNSTDTNGCYEPPRTTYGSWSAPDEWPCPDGDDDAEGNSHPFHPLAPSHAHDGSWCPRLFAGANPTNHGGSTDPEARCDYTHATRHLDIYFGNRPAPPPARRNALSDSEGSNAPFHDYHRAYPGAS